MRRWVVVAAAAAVLCVVVAACTGSSVATLHARGGAAPMGWSSWSFLRQHPTAAGVEAQARALRSSGLAAAGYRYVNLDDFWMACDSHGPEVDAYGRWVPDRSAFPGGIAPVARVVHALELKFGLYVTPGMPQNAVRRDIAVRETSLLGTDLTHLDPGDLALLKNRAVIAADQDGVATRPRRGVSRYRWGGWGSAGWSDESEGRERS